MIDYLIFYEIGVREFDSIALLGFELKRRGYTVEYIGFEDTDINLYIKNRKRLKKYRNNVRVAVMPSLYNDGEIYNSVYYVCGKCQNIVNLRWEQYFEKYSMDDLKCAWFPTNLAKVAYHLCWGKISYESLAVRGIDSKYLPITGPIQMDFLRPEFHGFFETKDELFSQYQLDPQKHTVLYISSFATATITERLQAKVQNDFDGEYEYRTDSFEFHRRSYKLTIDWIEKFLIEHKDVQFVYRPHPAENVTDYITKLNKYDNFVIIMDKSVQQWIITCETVTTWVSTAIAEAHFAGKSCFVIRPIKYPEDIDICYYSNVSAVETVEDFLNILEADASESIEPEVYDACYDFDRKMASYIRTANVLEAVLRSEEKFPWDDKQANSFDKRKKKFYLRNIAFYIYLAILKIGLFVNNKFEIKFFGGLQTRIDGIKAMKNNPRYKHNQDLTKVIDRVNSFFDKKQL